jgi:hypothetical protein
MGTSCFVLTLVHIAAENGVMEPVRIVLDLTQQCESRACVAMMATSFRLQKPLDFYTVLALEVRVNAHTLPTPRQKVHHGRQKNRIERR